MKKLGLALGSGGARGLVHIGVLKNLQKHNIKVDFIAGTSIGALVGAMYAKNPDPQYIYEKFSTEKWNTFMCLLDPSITGGVVKGEKLKVLVKNWINAEDFDSLQLPFTAVAADLISGREVLFSTGDLITAVRSSMAVPTMFKPIPYMDMLLADGGLANPVPDDVVKRMGADVVLSVNLDSRLKSINENADYKRITRVSRRAFHIIRHYLAEYSIRDSDIVIAPELMEPDFIGLKTYYNPEKAEKFIKIGEDMMESNMDKLKGLLE